MNLVNHDPAMLAALIPAFALAAILIGWSLINIARKPVKHLPKVVWVLIVLLVIPLGAILYLVLGRSRGDKLVDEDLL